MGVPCRGGGSCGRVGWWGMLVLPLLTVMWTLPRPGGSFSLSSVQGFGVQASAPPTSLTSTPSGPLSVLVLGGNGFMGGLTAEKLLAAGHKVVTVSRGNWYWDSAFLVKPYVTSFTCDRLYSLDKCTGLLDLVSNGTTFDVLIDFSAYHVFAVTEVLRVLKGRIKLYVYISTDSVYDVCDKNHSQPSAETDAVRPQSEQRRQELESVETYGHRKLQIEEELARQREGGEGVPYLSLRLPDVVGPKDNTYRWWIYQLWLRLADHLEKAPAIPGYLLNTPLSLVYSRDVANVLMQLLTPRPELLDQAFNLAFTETPTLLQLLDLIKAELNITNLPIQTDNSSQAVHLFPSVKNGPVDITKAQALLGFVPTPLHTAVTETVAFYEKAMVNPYYHIPRKDIIRNMQVHFTSRPFKVMLGLKKHYGLDFQMPKDEL
ncbi:uncharacterized protein LOC143298702 [Babylonia areolata]|uniref:uncharacterized protein LOC143298702 n=1 Tax=Babylonia areolata TaxID=304850 RepID=UPI003FD53A2D